MDTILKISDAANMAIHALASIGQTTNASQSVNRISTELGVSETHLSKVLQRVVKAGLVTSRRGPHGGFLLSRKPDSISLLEILEAIDGRLVDCKCLLGRKRCLFGGCAMDALASHVNHQVRAFMATHYLKDMMGSPRKHARFLAGLGGVKGKKPRS
jgi:Rrf2 family protein